MKYNSFIFVDICVLKIYIYFLFGLVKLIFRLPRSEEYLSEGLPGILKFCKPSSPGTCPTCPYWFRSELYGLCQISWRHRTYDLTCQLIVELATLCKGVKFDLLYSLWRSVSQNVIIDAIGHRVRSRTPPSMQNIDCLARVMDTTENSMAFFSRVCVGM